MMMADNTKRVVVIKNISSNLIEEAILILKNGPDAAADSQPQQAVCVKAGKGNELILREAEDIINQYIKENGLAVKKGNNRVPSAKKRPRIRLSANAIINISMAAAFLLLIFVVSKLF
jgi:hypothetical protein